MKNNKIIVPLSILLLSMAAYATPVTNTSLLDDIKNGKEVECVGFKKLMQPNKTGVYKKNTVTIERNELGDSFEATEEESDALGGYSPIPYPCKVIEDFTSEDLNITSKKVFVCEDDSNGLTEEVYLLENCVL